MQDELISAVGLVIVYGAAVVLGMLTQRFERSDITRQWTFALACFALDEAIAVAGRVSSWNLPFRQLSWGAMLGAGFFALTGTWRMIGKPVSRAARVSFTVVLVALAMAALLGVDMRVMELMVFEGLGAVLLWAGRLIFKHVSPPGVGRWLTSSAFVAGGLYAASWPLILASQVGRRLEFFLDLSVVLCAAAGGFFLHFERARVRIQHLAQQELELRAQLEQSERLEALGRLAGGVAHDFNNVLTTVIHGSELVLRQIEDRPKAAEHLRVVLESAQGAAQFTRQLLTLGRRRLPGRRPVEIQAALASALGMIRPSLPQKVSLVTTVPEVPLQVRSGQGQIEQILVNLALNALDSMQDGGTLTIQMTSNEPWSKLTIVVSDTGYGMDEAVLLHIFEPFFSTKSGHGTGLGLASVYAIVKQLEGSIVVKSALGEGTTFVLSLPCQPSPEIQLTDTVSSFPPTGVKVLVVDDQLSVLSSVSNGLADEGYQVTMASSAAEALLKVGQEAPSLLLTDLCMPDTDGLELLRCLRKRFPGLPAILMTAHSNDAETESGRFDVHWLPKPFTRQQLRLAIDSALESGRLLRARTSS